MFGLTQLNKLIVFIFSFYKFFICDLLLIVDHSLIEDSILIIFIVLIIVKLIEHSNYCIIILKCRRNK